MISFLYNHFRRKKHEKMQREIASDIEKLYDAERKEGDRRLGVSHDALDALEKKSGIAIDRDGRCVCRKCGHTLSAIFDHCINCNAGIKWDAGRRVMEAVIKREAEDFLGAMGCVAPYATHLSKSASRYILLARYTDGLDGSVKYQISTEYLCGDVKRPLHIRVKYTRGYKLMRDSIDEQEELARLTFDATRKLCSHVLADFASIEESTLRLLPLYQETVEELRQAPEKVASWLLEKGVHYHAAKNFLQGGKDAYSTDDFSTRFYCDHA